MPSKMKWREENTENPLLANTLLRQSAIDAFSSQSYGEASLNEILKRAKLNKGSFYYRFYDKTDLYLSVISIIADEKVKAAKEYGCNNAGNSFFGLLREQARINLLFARQYPQYSALWKKVIDEDKSIRGVIDAEFGTITSARISDLISPAFERGEIRSDLPKPLIVNIVGSFFKGLEATLQPNSSEQEILALVEDTITLLKEGLSAKNNQS